MSSSNDVAQDVDWLGAIQMALIGAANQETALKLIENLIESGPKPNGDALWPTKLLIEAIENVGGSYTT